MKIRRKSRAKRIRIIWIGCLVLVAILVGVLIFYKKSSSVPYASSQPNAPAAETKKTIEKAKEQPQEYTVPSAHPRQLIIKKLNIKANIFPMGLTKDGALDAPKTAWDVGWYNQSTLPGTGRGALLIDGHVNDALNKPGVFYSLSSLQAGDELQIQRGDNQISTYSVVKVDQKPLEQVNMAKMLQSITLGKEGLNLITCGGNYDFGRQTYQDRVLIYAERIL